MHKKYEAYTSPDRCKKSGDSQHVEGFRCLTNKYQCKIAISLVILVACATRRKSLNTRGSQVPEHIN